MASQTSGTGDRVLTLDELNALSDEEECALYQPPPCPKCGGASEPTGFGTCFPLDGSGPGVTVDFAECRECSHGFEWDGRPTVGRLAKIRQPA